MEMGCVNVIYIILTISICLNLFQCFMYWVMAYDFRKFRKMVDNEIDPIIEDLKERLKHD